jgi:hypothetical protein
MNLLIQWICHSETESEKESESDASDEGSLREQDQGGVALDEDFEGSNIKDGMERYSELGEGGE